MSGTEVIRRRLTLLLLAYLFSGPAVALESEKDFAKCQQMLDTYSSWLTDKANEADRKLGEKIESMVDRQASRAADTAAEKARLFVITDRIAQQYELDLYRQSFVDEIVDAFASVENTDDFHCMEKARIKSGFKASLEKYEQVLDEVEVAVKDRLDIENLGPDEGLVVILLYVKGYAEQVDINRLGAIGGGIRFGPIRNNDFFRVFRVKAGDYRWHSIWYKSWGVKMTAHLRHSKSDFSVVAGKLNYSGVFIYESDRAMGYRTKVADRTSVVLSLLESRYPELLEAYGVNDGLTADNRFLDFYFSEKRAAADRSDDDGA